MKMNGANMICAALAILIIVGANAGDGTGEQEIERREQQLFDAIGRGQTKEVQNLLEEQGVSVDALATAYSWTPLMAAVESGNIDILNMLLKKGADINRGSFNLLQLVVDPGTPIYTNDIPTVLRQIELLIDYGVDVNAANIKGQTALMAASKKGNQAVIQLLLEKKADIGAVDNNGNTALDYAKGNAAVLNVLRDHQKRLKEQVAGEVYQATPLSADVSGVVGGYISGEPEQNIQDTEQIGQAVSDAEKEKETKEVGGE